jgi:hypothetical protein
MNKDIMADLALKELLVRLWLKETIDPLLKNTSV